MSFLWDALACNLVMLVDALLPRAAMSPVQSAKPAFSVASATTLCESSSSLANPDQDWLASQPLTLLPHYASG